MNKKTLKSAALVLLLSFLGIFNSAAQSQELSVDEVLSIFYQRNLDLIAAQYNIDRSLADAVIASAIPNPTVGFQIGELSASNMNKGSNATGCNHNTDVSCGAAEYYSFSQLIEVAGKRGLRIQSSGFATQAAESDFRDAVRIFSNMVRNSYYQLLQTQKNRWLAQEIVDHYEIISKANSLRMKKGDISESDFLRVKMEAMRGQADLDNAQAAVELAQADLAVILRWPDKSLQFEAKEQWPEVNNIGQNLSKEDLIGKALQQRPDLQGDKLRAEQADRQLELARRLKYPDVTVTGGYAHDPSNNALNTGFVGVSVPLPLFYQYQGEADKAAVNLSQSRLVAEQTELVIRSDVIGALATWNSAKKIVQRFRDGLLDDALAVRNSSELAYSKGATSVLDFIEAQRSYKNVMRDYYAAEINRANAYYDLEKSLGAAVDGDKAPVARGNKNQDTTK
ncbi:TolC family protein [Methylobacter sp. S3L5C]|uniref:TolC family protein n=1 Tax=Methylobacter sp. S3L5C TaxID=2839024 RepID=UPI001FAC2634|nr:TolC family protein [Methylobacter sp. S3L5C]UOA10010.1 TolC family protein [Methylobacter sp. S3L5C]